MAPAYSFQLIHGDGSFNSPGLKSFVVNTNFAERGLSYAAISIIGAQSTGKSTLLNRLFKTSFDVMDASKQRHQTTRGIFLAKLDDMDPTTIVMDVEGTDGDERGDDTIFERQSTLFVLAVSDIVLINMLNSDVNRFNASGKPLLTMIFQVMTKLVDPRMRTLLYVIRDHVETPLNYYETKLKQDTEQIWNSVPKSGGYRDKPFGDFFNVVVELLPHYKTQEFAAEVVNLRKKINGYIAPGGVAGDRSNRYTSTVFVDSLESMWDSIRADEDLDLPSLMVTISRKHCERIAGEAYAAFTRNETWLCVEMVAQTCLITGFGEALNDIFGGYLAGYKKDAKDYDGSVVSDCERRLKKEILELVQPSYRSQLYHLGSEAFEGFTVDLEEALNRGHSFHDSFCECKEKMMSEFNNGCADLAIMHANWDASEDGGKLEKKIQEHATTVLKKKCKEELDEGLANRVNDYVERGDDRMWTSIRNVLREEMQTADNRLCSAHTALDINAMQKQVMLAELQNYAADIVVSKVKSRGREVLLNQMTTRFDQLFDQKLKHVPAKFWSSELRTTATRTGKEAAVKLLAVMAAIRLEDKPDDIEDTLLNGLIESPENPSWLRLTSWKNVPPSQTLLNPDQCKTLWEDFLNRTQDIIKKAERMEQAERNLEETKTKLASSKTELEKVKRGTQIVQDVVTASLAGISAAAVGVATRNPAMAAATFAMLNRPTAASASSSSLEDTALALAPFCNIPKKTKKDGKK